MRINKILGEKRNNASSQYGAQMGRGDRIGDEKSKLHLQRVDFVDGDYDTGGAYWGRSNIGTRLYCAFSKDETTMVFVRASNRKHAKELLSYDRLKGWEFYP